MDKAEAVMNDKEVWHRHLGSYGICHSEGKLLVIRKRGGPYTRRYDLPGGSLEPLQSLQQTVEREFIEESGIRINIKRCLGTRDYVVAWRRENFDHTHCHHIAILYEALYADGDVANSPNIDDSDGAEWIDMDKLQLEDASPLVRDAVHWIRTGHLPVEAARFDDWKFGGTSACRRH
ncbi:NUDIX domain-containing protein [Paenibacillus hemerocallicola]|nr:NUDIX hydrolase [Paenibacillus hemerocallicola]